MAFKKNGRYTVPSDEDFEPGSNQEVLKNFFAIKSKEKMEALEERELGRAESELLTLIDEDHQFTVEDICAIHELWLGEIYPFAGKYRTVNISKEGFSFALASRIVYLMAKFESDYLAKYTPCHYSDVEQLASALGIVHVEFILIHPFREGNGRVARLLADLMSMQSKNPPLNYSAIDRTVNGQGFVE
jgi:cell filamentation protein